MSADDPFRAEAGAVVDDLTGSDGLPDPRAGAPARRRSAGARRISAAAARVFPVVGGLRRPRRRGRPGRRALRSASRSWSPPASRCWRRCSLTGGLHEDGLADTADGFGGGATAERKLEIMDDSRIGTFGAAALVFSILFRVAALSSIAAFGPWRAALALVAAEAVSRAALVRLWHELPAARLGGLAHETGPPDQQAMLVALVLAAVIVALTVMPTAGFVAAVVRRSPRHRRDLSPSRA